MSSVENVFRISGTLHVIIAFQALIGLLVTSNDLTFPHFDHDFNLSDDTSSERNELYAYTNS